MRGSSSDGSHSVLGAGPGLASKINPDFGSCFWQHFVCPYSVQRCRSPSVLTTYDYISIGLCRCTKFCMYSSPPLPSPLHLPFPPLHPPLPSAPLPSLPSLHRRHTSVKPAHAEGRMPRGSPAAVAPVIRSGTARSFLVGKGSLSRARKKGSKILGRPKMLQGCGLGHSEVYQWAVYRLLDR